MNPFLPYAPARPFSLMMQQTRRRLTVTSDLPGDASILRDPFRPLLAACAAAAAVAPDIKVLEGRVVSGDQFVSPTEQKERILATFGDLCCEMEGCTIAQAAYLNGVPPRRRARHQRQALRRGPGRRLQHLREEGRLRLRPHRRAHG
ncbi:hypothetical protein [Collinsella sp. TF10-11AT]|uniref:phosphorylase family protein n=1 Tax=unclassified Collinsella TaxID=2637548 RepID=UPI0035189F2C